MRIKNYIIPEVIPLFKYETRPSLRLKKSIDQYGNFLETELSSIFKKENEIIENSDALSINFASDGVYGETDDWKQNPGGIEDITDFSEIICFGESGDGAPFCLDYRETPPSVIWWDDTYWRKISDDISRFLSLFDTESAHKIF